MNKYEREIVMGTLKAIVGTLRDSMAFLTNKGDAPENLGFAVVIYSKKADKNNADRFIYISDDTDLVRIKENFKTGALKVGEDIRQRGRHGTNPVQRDL